MAEKESQPSLMAQGRFEEAGAWNAVVTHRVRIHEPGELDEEVLAWLQRAFDLLPIPFTGWVTTAKNL